MCKVSDINNDQLLWAQSNTLQKKKKKLFFLMAKYLHVYQTTWFHGVKKLLWSITSETIRDTKILF